MEEEFVIDNKMKLVELTGIYYYIYMRYVMKNSNIYINWMFFLEK